MGKLATNKTNRRAGSRKQMDVLRAARAAVQKSREQVTDAQAVPAVEVPSKVPPRPRERVEPAPAEAVKPAPAPTPVPAARAEPEPEPAPEPAPHPAPEPVVLTTEAISAMAHQVWLDRGRPVGMDAENWAEAEAILRSRAEGVLGDA